MANNKMDFLLMDIVLFIILIGLTILAFDTHGKFFIVEYLMLIFFIVLSFVAMAGIFTGSNWGWPFLAVIFGLFLLDLVLMQYMKVPSGKLLIGLMLFASFGFFISVVKIKRPIKRYPITHEHKQEEKYVASSSGKKYHKATCDWAKKIKEGRKIYLTAEEADKKGLKACDCTRK